MKWKDKLQDFSIKEWWDAYRQQGYQGITLAEFEVMALAAGEESGLTKLTPTISKEELFRRVQRCESILRKKLHSWR